VTQPSGRQSARSYTEDMADRSPSTTGASFEDFLQEQLADPEFRAGYEKRLAALKEEVQDEVRCGNERVLMLPLLATILTGIFLAVAAHSLNWSGTDLLVVGCGMVGLISLLGLPLIALTTTLLDKKPPQVPPALPLAPQEPHHERGTRHIGYVTGP